MITPFGPPNDELDRLNTALDAQVTGKRAPETGPASDTDLLAATAHFIALQPETPGETPSTDTLDSIWRNVMHAHAIPAQPDTGNALPGRQDDIGRVHPVGGPEPATFSSWVSLAAVAALLIGIVGAAWGLRQGGGGDEPPIRLAATALDETPVAQENEWLTWVTPEECTAEPMTTEEYADIMREEPDISGRSYEVIGPADPETAEAVASAARTHIACVTFRNISEARSLQTRAYTFFQSASDVRTITSEELEEQSLEHSLDLSAQYPTLDPTKMLVVPDEKPHPDMVRYWREMGLPPSEGFFSSTFDPNQAVTLADGRVAIPAILLWWDPGSPDGTPSVTEEPVWTGLAILIYENGAWKVDEMLYLCYAEECTTVWEQTGYPSAAQSATPIATPED